MRTTKSALLTIGVMSGLLIACSPQQSSLQNQPDNAPLQQAKLTQSESARLIKFFEESYQQDLKRSPQTQSYRGYKWDYDKWNDVSDDHAEESKRIREERLAILSSFDTSDLSQQLQLSHQIMTLALQRQSANDEFRHHHYVMHQFYGFHTQIPSFLINIHRISDKKDAQDYIARLIAVDSLFDQVITLSQKRREIGAMPPGWVYDQMIQASHNVISGIPFEQSTTESTIWKDFTGKVEKLGLSESDSSELVNSARTALLGSVLPAYKKLIANLETERELTPEGDGVWRLPDGDAWYQNRLNWFTTTKLNADEVHQIGLDNVERIHESMRDIMKQVGFEGDLNAFFDFMRTDQQFYYPSTAEGRQHYMAKATALIATMEAKIPEYFGLTPKARMTVKRVEPFREKSAGKAFYQSPSTDGSRPGTYYANLYNMQDMPTYQMEALAYHEGIPGHHMQRAIAQELEGIPDFQKYVSFTAYTEGWGLYTEELAKDMGFYQDPYSDFGRLAMELWRACRLVVDTGIHAKKWSREKAIDYLIQNTPNPENDVVKAIERYIAMPGQATAYMIGKLKIMELRAWSQNYLGDKFDIKGFHDEILKDGPVPLSVLENKIKAWAETLKQG